MVPRIANTFARGEHDKLKDYMNKSFQFVLVLAFPLMFGITSVANKFVPIFYGTGYAKVVYLIMAISPILVAIGLSNVVGTQYLLPTKKQKEFTISVTLGAIVNVILNAILINLWKSIGASIATVIAEFTVTGIQFYLARKEISIIDVLKVAKNYFIASIIMFNISLILGKFINNNMLSIILQASCGGIAYLSVLIILKDRIIDEAVNLFKSKFKIDSKRSYQ